jgi:hypothetical protein
MQLSALKNEGLRHLSAATALKCCGQNTKQHWQLIYQETEAVQTARSLGFQEHRTKC